MPSAKNVKSVETNDLTGLSIGAKLVSTFLLFIALLGVLLAFVYQRYVPGVVMDQINLRTYSIAQSFGAAILEPLVVKNYLRVNKIAEATATLPGVAYASVINKRGVPVAGIFSDLQRFDDNFSAVVKDQGFPPNVVEANPLRYGEESSQSTFLIGGQEISDVALPIGETGAQVHVGLFTDDVNKSLRETLLPLAILLLVMALLGALTITYIARTISRPIRQLAAQADQISMGRLEHHIEVQGGGEIRQLADAFGRMQSSLQYIASHRKKQ